MQLSHPFEHINLPVKKRIFFLLFIVTIAVMAALRSYDAHLITHAAPNGIVSYEFAGSMPKAQAMIKSWGDKGRIYAGLSLGIDYLFLIVYSLTIGLGCVMIGQRLSKKFSFAEPLGTLLAWGLITASILDAVENLALIKVLTGSVQDFWLTIAWYCAAPKFLLVGLGLFYLLSGAILSIFIKR